MTSLALPSGAGVGFGVRGSDLDNRYLECH